MQSGTTKAANFFLTPPHPVRMRICQPRRKSETYLSTGKNIVKERYCMTFYYKPQRWRYETLGSSELLSYQGTMNFDTRTEAQITTSSPMFYDRVLAIVDYSCLQFIRIKLESLIIKVVNNKFL